MNYFEEPTAAILEEDRGKARVRRRIIYDCYFAVVRGDDGVVCQYGDLGIHKGNAPRPLLNVLRGGASMACQSCNQYNA